MSKERKKNMKKEMNTSICFSINISTTEVAFYHIGILLPFILIDIYILQPLATVYGLAKHRDGRWAWAVAPGVSPSPRYQHAAVSSFSAFPPP